MQLAAWRKWNSVLTIYAVIAGLAVLSGQRKPVVVAMVPLVGLSGFVFLGHLITLDDDAPGAWSNPNGSVAAWRASLLQLLRKGIVFAAFVTIAALTFG